MIDPAAHLFWITSRAAGTTAMVCASASVGVGLAIGGRMGGRRAGGGADRRGIHQTLALATLGAIAVHGLTLLGDGYLHPSLADIAVPFHLSYQRLATATGIVAGWALALLAASYYARRLIGQRRWRAIHRFTLVAWVAGLVHALTEGSDAGQTWFLVLLATTAAPVAVLAIVRLAGARRSGIGPSGRGPAGRGGPGRVRPAENQAPDYTNLGYSDMPPSTTSVVPVT
ncbi:MAG: hypothetical protein ACRDMJ_12130 [Solirubrobacteraceae bacterium]